MGESQIQGFPPFYCRNLGNRFLVLKKSTIFGLANFSAYVNP